MTIEFYKVEFKDNDRPKGMWEGNCKELESDPKYFTFIDRVDEYHVPQIANTVKLKGNYYRVKHVMFNFEENLVKIIVNNLW